MTRGDIYQDLINQIGPGPEVTGQGLINWINESYLYIVDEIQKVNPNYFNKRRYTDLNEGQREYDLPEDADEITMVNVYMGGKWQRALPLQDGINQVPVYNDTTNTQGFSEAEPRYYIRDRKIGILPSPTSTVDDGLEIWHVYDPEEMTADTDEPAIPKKYHYGIKRGAYANYLDEDDQHGAAVNVRAQFESWVERVVESLTSDQTDESKSILITNGLDLYEDDPTWYS